MTKARWGELAALRREHLDLVRATVRVARTLVKVGNRLEALDWPRCPCAPADLEASV